jgi:hypothetical protein
LSEYRDHVRDERPGVAAQLSVVLSMSDRGITWDAPEMLFIQAVVEEWLSMLDPGDYDELLERAYYKLYNEWPVDPPWFVKAHSLPWPLP